MAAKYILAALAFVFLVLAVSRMGRRADGGAHPQTKTWLIIAVLFGVVSAWLFYQG